MAQVTAIKVTESDSTLVLRLNFLSDGTGELVNYPVLAPSDLVPPRQNNRPAFRIKQIWYGLARFDVTFLVNTLTPVPLWTLARDCDSHVCFEDFGGLIDQNVYAVPPSVDDGILMVSTINFAPVGSQGSIVLQLAKTNEP